MSENSSASIPSNTSSAEASNTAVNGQGEAIELLEGETIDQSEESSGGAISASSGSSAKSSEPSKSEVKKAADKVDAKQAKGSSDKYTIKVDGQNLELSKDELVKYAQLGKAGQARMEEAARIKQEATQLVKMLRENPEAVLADPYVLGSEDKVIELAQKILARKEEDSKKSPEAREKERLERELEALREQVRADEENRKIEEYNRLVAQAESQLEEQITEAFESSQLPKSPFVLKRLTDVMIAASENNKEISPKQALSIVKKEMQKDIKDYMEALQEDALEEYISEQKLQKLRKRQLAKAKQLAPKVEKPTEVREGASAPVEAKKVEKINMKKFLRG